MAVADKIRGWWKLDEQSGVRADSHDNAYDLADVNTVGFAAGILGNAADFVGANSERLVGAYAGLQPTGAFSISFWTYNIGSAPANTSIISYGDRAAGNNVYTLTWNLLSLNRTYFFLRDSGGTERTVYIVGPVVKSSGNPGWDHWVCSWDGVDTISIKLNNTNPAQVRSANPTSVYSTANQNLFVGSEGTSTRFYTGRVDELSYHEGKLTDAEITEVYNGGLATTYEDFISATPPLAPTLLTATATAGTKIALAWNDESDDEDGFVVEQSIDDNTNYGEIHVTAANVESYLVEGLISGRRYFHRVKARNAEGDSAYTNEVSTVTLFGPVTSTFRQIKVTSGFRKREVTSNFHHKKVTSTFTKQ